MPDRPDWSKYLPGSERHSLEDLSELAARLWTPVVYDRRGEVIWMDQFDHGLSNYRTMLGGGSDSVTLIADYPHYGGYAAKLLTTGQALRLAGLRLYAIPPVENKWGIEVGVNFRTIYDSFTLDFQYYSGTYYHEAYILLDYANDNIQVKDDGSFVEVATLGKTVSFYGMIHHLKLVVDFENDVYVRALFNSREFDLSEYVVKTTSNTAVGPLNQCRPIFIGRASNTDYCHISHMILTANEP